MRLAAMRYLLGNLTYAGAQFVIVMLLSKFGSPASVGQYALGLAVTAPVFMLSHLHLRAMLTVDVAGRYAIGEYAGLRLLTTIAAFGISGAIALLGRFGAETVAIILLISVSRVIESISDLWLGICQKHERLDTIAASRAAKGLFSMISIALVYIPTHSLSLALLTMITGWFCLTLGLEGRRARQLATLRPVFTAQRLLLLLRACAPLGVVLALLSLNANIPAYSIAAFRGEHELGIYASLSYFIVACNVVVTALGEAATPRLALWHAAGLHGDFIRLLRRLMAIGLTVSAAALAGGWLYGQELLALLYSPAMADETRLFHWILVSTVPVFAASFLWYALTATGQFKVQVPLFLATASANALVCLLAVPGHGLVGAAAGALAAAGVQTAGGAAALAAAIRKAKRAERGRAAA
ncbi:lipopolysaccharide biosynthesis protein [Paenibacillus sp. HJGM_3]|uniref:lipopolysaccharide biosynthesis protein n=1 Tax=Paenibacillus sp. HJGM_3 TaxID=3379816 RepID=UPI00385C088F